MIILLKIICKIESAHVVALFDEKHEHERTSRNEVLKGIGLK